MIGEFEIPCYVTLFEAIKDFILMNENRFLVLFPHANVKKCMMMWPFGLSLSNILSAFTLLARPEPFLEVHLINQTFNTEKMIGDDNELV